MILVCDTFVSSENLKQEKIVISKNSRKYKATPQSPDVAKTRPHPSRLFFLCQFGFLLRSEFSAWLFIFLFKL